MAIGKQEIINSALMSFGNRNLESTDVEYVDIKYDVLYQQLASSEYWNFLQVITDLGMISDTYELVGYKYKYLLPADSGNIYSVFSQYNIDSDYRIIGNYIHSNTVSAKCQYTTLTKLESLPPHFANCLSYLLGSQLCLVLGSANSQANLYQLYLLALKDAKLINGRDIPSLSYTNDYYSRARVNGYI